MDVLYYIAIIAMVAADFWVWLIVGLGVIVLGGWLFRRRRHPSSLVFHKLAVAVVIIAITTGCFMVFMGVYQFWYTHRPIPAPEQRALFNGVTYIRDVRSVPRPLVIHIVQIQLDRPGIGFLVTPGDPNKEYPLTAQTASQFLTKHDLQLAINGDFFEPWWSNGIFNYYPHKGDPVDVSSFSSSHGIIYSETRPNYPTLYLSENNVPTLNLDADTNPYNAISGNVIFVKNGKASLDFPQHNYHDEIHPRTAIAIDRDGKILMIFVVDGRQPNYSEGVSMQELAEIVMDYEGQTALNLDGGGSSTLVMESASGEAVVLNSPIDQRIPGRERPVANHLGIFAK